MFLFKSGASKVKERKEKGLKKWRIFEIGFAMTDRHLRMINAILKRGYRRSFVIILKLFLSGSSFLFFSLPYLPENPERKRSGYKLVGFAREIYRGLREPDGAGR